MISLIVNSKSLELPDQRIPINFQGNDASNISELFVSFTNSFSIPHTDYNNDILENAHQLFSESMLPYKSIECFLIINGRDQFGASRLVLLESNQQEWRASFYAGTSGVTMAGSIQSLILGTFPYDASAIEDAVLNEYPLLINTSPTDTGYMKRVVDQEIDWNLARPNVYVSSILVNMLAQGGITLNIDTRANFAKRIILPLQDLRKISIEHEGYSFKSKRITSAQTLPDVTDTTLIFNSVTEGNTPTGTGGYDITDGIFRIPYHSKLSVKATIKLNVIAGAGVARIFKIMFNSSQRGRVEYTPDATGTHSISISVDNAAIQEVMLVGPDTGFAIVQILYFGGSGSDDQLMINSELEIEVTDEAIAGDTVDIAKSLPEMSRADLMKEFLMLFNGITYYKNGTLTITSFNDLPERSTKDWSQKVDMESDRTILMTSPLGQATQFKYDNDGNVDPNLGCAQVTIDNQNISASVVYHTSKFAAAKDVALLGLNMMQIPMWEATPNSQAGDASHSGGGGNFNMTLSEWPDIDVMGNYIRIPHLGKEYLILSTTPGSPGTVTVAGPTVIPNFSNVPFEIVQLKRQKINPRFGIVSEDDVAGSINYRLNNDDVTVTLFKEITFSELNWKTLLTNNYRLWLGSMEKYKMVRLYVVLDESDVMEFDTTNAIYIEGQGIFYCQGLNKYVGEGEPIEAELITLKAPIEVSKITDL